MRYTFRGSALLIAILAPSVFLHAQQHRGTVLYHLIQQKRKQAVAFHAATPFTRNNRFFKLDKNRLVGTFGVGLNLDPHAVARLYKDNQEAITLAIPAMDGVTYMLDLIRQPVNVSGDFSFGTLSADYKKHRESGEQGLHYRGVIDGDSTSMASVSIFSNGDLMGVFSNDEGNFNIGKSDSTDSYVVYNSNDLPMPASFECQSLDVPRNPAVAGLPQPAAMPVVPQPEAIPALLCKKVRIYFEASYNLYSYNFHSNLTATRNYLLGLFNQIATMYQNEGIQVELSQTYVWTTPDSYDTTRSDSALYQFQRRWNNMGDTFNADVAHLLMGGSHPVNGGIAYVLPGSICFYRSYAYSYTNVFGSYSSVPTYSWDVEAVTHELGHNFGSHHTHWCGWNTGPGGSCGAIDNCYTEEPNDDLSCMSCPAQTDTATRPPGWKGTVMSYCHLTAAIGINLANGFGPLPQAVIRNIISSSSCLGTTESWSGTTSSAWETSSNWSCGSVPDASTDVNITQGAPHYPVINSNAACHSLTMPSGTSVEVSTGKSLNVTGVGTVNGN